MANDNKGLTPMMRQFFEMKSKHPEALLLFRCGDFYETYCEDAIEASRILGITLTRRNNGGSAGGATNWKTRRRNVRKSRARRDSARWTRW